MKNFLVLIILFFLFSCAKEQPKVAWIKIDSWDLLPNSNAVMNQGELSHKFSYVFLNVDGSSLGVYELPAKIPLIVTEGDHNIVLLPGVVSTDGMSTKIERYPFVESFDENFYLKVEDTITISPFTKYYSTINFLIEDFESPSMQVDVSDNSVASIGRNNDPDILKWGNNYGEILLNTNDSLLVLMTTFGNSYPKPGVDVYLEFDYMNTNSFMTSVLSYGSDGFFDDPLHILTPQNKPVWKHTYYNLKQVLSHRMSSQNNEIQLSFLLDDEKTSSYVYIDNIKVIFP